MRCPIVGAVAVAAAFVCAPVLAGGIVAQLTDQKRVGWDGVSLDSAGDTVYASSTVDVSGTNPSFAPQIVAWGSTGGTPSVLASIVGGATTGRDAVSSDGAWLAFLSKGNPTGGNPDGTVELFVMRTDGTLTRQLTTTPIGAGAIRGYALSGSGNRVVFYGDVDPLGTNAAHRVQLFDINADGTSLRQLTTVTTSSDFDVSISDDGTRIAFACACDLTGGNPDLSWEIFTIAGDGTGLAELTATAGTSDTAGARTPRLAGNGSRIAFGSAENIAAKNPLGTARIWTIDWAGTNLRTVSSTTPSADPAITDDGQDVVYDSSDPALGNTDLNSEIWKVKYDGTGKIRLTNTAPPTACRLPEIARGGGRIAFRADGAIGSLNPDGGPALLAMDGTGGSLTLLVDGKDDPDRAPDLTPDGTRLVFDSARDPFGTNPSHHRQLFREQTDGTALTQVTALADGDVWHARVSGDGGIVTFVSDANPTGGNAAHNDELFSIHADGTGLTQVSPGSTQGLGAQTTPAISRNGTWIVFQSVANYTGGNADGSPELYRVHPDGTGLLELTADDDSVYKLPRVDDGGVWVAFQSAAGGGPTRIFRVKTDGTGLQAITSFTSYYPDISGAGDRIAFVSHADPLGTNADGSAEVFVWDAAPATLRQVTSLSSGEIGRVRLSRDGAYVTFLGTAPVFEANPGGVYAPYRVEVATGAIVRIGALGVVLDAGTSRYGDFIATDDHGLMGAFVSASDPTGLNPDGSTEIFVADLSRAARTTVGKASPTRLWWDADAQALRYDVVRGDVRNLALAGGTVDLGPVTCLANDRPALDTTPYPDAAEPAPGQVFFYLLRGSQGLADGPGSYGQGSGNRERVAGTGDCPK